MFDYLPHLLENILLKVWNFNIPLKLKCFTWLSYNKKLNTWDNLHKRGWIGPDRCSICKLDAETSDHLFVDCFFLHEVLHNLDCSFNVQLVWSDSTLSGNPTRWFSKDGDLLYLPIFLIWNLWKTRNYIFENIEPNISIICHRVMLEVSTHQVPHIKKPEPEYWTSKNIVPHGIF